MKSLLTTLLLAAALSSCTGTLGKSSAAGPGDDDDDRDGDSDAEGASDGGDADDDRPSSDDGDGTVDVPSVNPNERCESSEVGPPMLRRLTRDELENSLRKVFPEVSGEWQGVKLSPDARQGRFTNDASALLVGNQSAAQILETAEELAALMTQPATLSSALSCASEGDAACASTLVKRYGSRLFRRSLSDAEQQRYVTLHTSIAAKSDFATAARWTLVALMQSPHALYRSELGKGDSFAVGSARKLLPSELAAELSYTFSGQPPSEQLLELAADGELDSPAARVREARKLLDSAGGHAVLAQFFAEWLDYQNVAAQTKESVGAPFLTLREQMVSEMQAFLDEVVHARKGGLDTLLTADFTVVGPELAEFYGFSSSATAPEVVTRPEGRGIGVLAQGALLANLASVTHSSPTRRGLLVYKRFLCQEMPPPPPGVSTDLKEVEAKTTRERIEQVHVREASCKGCHSQVDPIGFSLEHYDEAGRYRAQESGVDVNAAGALPRLKQEFEGQEGLARALAGSDEVGNCISGLMSIYASGGGGGQACLAESARVGLLSGESSIVEYFAAMAGEPHFVERKVAE